MTTKPIEQVEPVEDRNAKLDKVFIKEYLREKGITLEELKKLPANVAENLMKEASQYASLKLEAVEARAHFLKELQDDGSPLEI